MRRTTGRQFTNTSFRNSGRIAGDGIVSGNYSEESGYRPGPSSLAMGAVRFPNDGVKPEDLNGPVICYKMERKSNGKRND